MGRSQHGFPESDWRVFSELREVALERFCERLLEGIDTRRGDTGMSHHQRYLAICRWIGEQNREMALAFDNPKRAEMIRQLIAIWTHGLLEESEFSRFSPETRRRVVGVAEELSR